MATDTYPTISISTTTFATPKNTVALSFDYMPESVSFGVSATFEQAPIPYTSARWLTYSNSEIEEVTVNVKVVAGCNNCITRFAANTSNSGFSTSGGITTAKFERNSLIVLAQLLYSLPLPSSNLWVTNMEEAKPPPTCRFIVGRMFSGVGAFTRCSIQFNGPYDYDGSPTDMEVTLGFLPSEFYDSGSFTKMIESSAGLIPHSTPTGESLVTGDDPYALTFGETQTGLVEDKVVQEAVPEGAPAKPASSESGYGASAAVIGAPPPSATIAGDQVHAQPTVGPTTETPTVDEIAAAFITSPRGVIPDYANNRYIIDGKPESKAFVQNKVEAYRAQQKALGATGH